MDIKCRYLYVLHSSEFFDKKIMIDLVTVTTNLLVIV